MERLIGSDPRRDEQAERATLGALLMHPPAIARIPTVRSDDFHEPRHAVIFTAVHTVVDAADSAAVDAMNVQGELLRIGELTRCGGAPYLLDLAQSCPTVGAVEYYARRVQQAALRRKVALIGTQITDAAAANDLDDTLDRAAQLLVELQLSVDTPLDDARPVDGLSTLAEFVDATDVDYDWLIPGLIERHDRVIVVAAEGAGKSTLARQVAVLLAAGRHPFDPATEIPPQRTLIVDLENPPALVRRKLRWLVDPARKSATWRDENSYRWTRPGGINLRRHTDQALFDRVLSETRPALVVMGPIYKAFLDDGARSEQTAAELAFFLDRMREKHRIAYWLEAHAPLDQMGHRSLRPLGSGLWSRWPEFGIALRKTDRKRADSDLLLEPFRGHRDERSWPRGLRRGRDWPWEAIYDDYWADAIAGSS